MQRLLAEAARILAAEDGDLAQMRALLDAVESRRLTADAARALAAGEPDTAIEHARAALAHEPSHAPALRVLVDAQRASSRFEDALASLRSAAPRGADGEIDREFRATFEAVARARMAEIEREAAAESDAGVASVMRLRVADLAEEIGDWETALAVYTRSIGWDGDPTLLARARLLARLGESDRALADYRRIAGSGAAVDDALRRLLCLSSASGSAEVVQADLALVLDLLPEADRAWIVAHRGASGEHALEALAEYSRILCLRADFQRSPKGFADLAIDPGQSLCSFAEFLARTGVLALERGDGAGARGRAEAARSVCGDCFGATLLFARLTAVEGDPPRALSMLRAALEAEPGRAEEAAPHLRAVASMAAADLARALAAAPPGDADALRARLEELMALRLQAGESELAQAAADELVARVAEPGTRLVRGQLLDLLGQREPAVRDYRAGVESADAARADWLHLLELERELGDQEGLATDSERMLSRWPEDATARSTRIEALVSLDRKPAALAEAEAFIQRGPSAASLSLRRLELLQETGASGRVWTECLQEIRGRAAGCVGAARILAEEARAASRLDDLYSQAVSEEERGDRLAEALLLAVHSFAKSEDANAIYYIDWLKGQLDDAAGLACLTAEVHAQERRPTRALAALAGLADGAIEDFWAERIAHTLTLEEDMADVECRPHVLELLERLARSCPRARGVAEDLAQRLNFYREDLERTLAWRRNQARLADSRALGELRYEEAAAADRRGETASAIAGYAQVLALDPEHGRAASRLAVHRLVEGDPDAARETIRSAEVTPKIGREPVETWLAATVDQKRLDAFQPAHEPMSWNEAVVCACDLYRGLLRFDLAGELLLELRVAPDDAAMLRRRARAALDCRSYDLGLADALRCVELLPRDAGSRLVLVEAHALRGERDQAYAVLNEAIGTFPDRGELYLERADMRYADWGNDRDVATVRAALDDALRANELSPSHDALAIQALAHDALGEWQQAFECVDLMYRRYPEGWLPNLQRSAERRVEDFHEQLRQGAARGAAAHEAALAKARADGLAAEEERARLAAESDMRARREAAAEDLERQIRDSLERLLERGSMWSDPRFNALVDENRATSAELARRLRTEADRKARLREMERRFGYDSKAAEVERRRDD